MKKIILIAIACLLLVAVGGAFYYYNTSIQAIDKTNEEEVLVTIESGSSLGTIATTLQNEGIIKSASIFEVYVKLNGKTNLQAGTYRLSTSYDMEKITTMLSTGDVNKKVELKIAIPEGSNFRDIAEIISSNTEYTSEEVLEFLNNKEYIAALIAQYPTIFTDEILAENIKYPLEGYLYPATYTYLEKNPSLEELFQPMIAKTVEIYSSFAEQMQEADMTTHELLTFSSLIEEEATEKIDRDKISSVFYNRLAKGMPLQTDPTVLYALGLHKDQVLYIDLKVDDPYNTYRNNGLTPGPISNAGISSIEAVLNPADTDYEYFLAAKDGTVYFAKTFAEHKENIAKYLR